VWYSPVPSPVAACEPACANGRLGVGACQASAHGTADTECLPLTTVCATERRPCLSRTLVAGSFRFPPCGRRRSRVRIVRVRLACSCGQVCSHHEVRARPDRSCVRVRSRRLARSCRAGHASRRLVVGRTWSATVRESPPVPFGLASGRGLVSGDRANARSFCASGLRLGRVWGCVYRDFGGRPGGGGGGRDGHLALALRFDLSVPVVDDGADDGRALWRQPVGRERPLEPPVGPVVPRAER